MMLHRKSQSHDVTKYAPIAKTLSTLDAVSEEIIKKKFDVACLICKEQLAVTKMASLCELEEKHGVNLGSG